MYFSFVPGMKVIWMPGITNCSSSFYIAHNKYTIMTKYLLILLNYMYKLRDYVNTPMQSFDVIFTAM